MTDLLPTKLAQRLKGVVKSGGIYLLFSLLNRAIPFLLLPLLTRYISPEGFGTVSIIMVITAIAMPILGMCSNAVLFQRFYKMDQLSREYFINDCYKVILINTLLTCVLVIPFSSFIETRLKLGLGWFEVALLCAATGMVTTLTTSLFQIKRQALSYGVFQFANSITNVGFTLILVVVMEMSWIGRVLGILLSSVLVCLFAFYLNWKNSDINLINIKKSPQILTIYKLGSALIPSTIAGWGISMSDRLFLTSLTNLEVVGIYAIGVMIAQITDVLLNAMGQAYIPYIFQYGRTEDPKIKIRIVQGVYLAAIVCLLTAFSVTIIAPVIMKLMINSRYHEALPVVGWISFSYAFFSMATPFHSLILSAEKNYVTIYVSIFTLIINLIGNYILIGCFGMTGAAMGNALSAAAFMLLLMGASLVYNRMPWLDRRVFIFSRDK